MKRMIIAKIMNPTQWAAKQSFLPEGTKLEGCYRVTLEDGREINTWWQNGQWSVEKHKPNLKVFEWEEPVFKA